jgi:predicted negative regulator of RcsB-dependent stress response
MTKLKTFLKTKKTIIIMSLVIGLLIVTNWLNYNAKLESQQTISKQQSIIQTNARDTKVLNGRIGVLENTNRTLNDRCIKLFNAYAKEKSFQLSADDREYLKNWMEKYESK